MVGMFDSEPTLLPAACPACGEKLRSVQSSRRGRIGRYACGGEYRGGEPPREVHPCPASQKLEERPEKERQA